LKAVLKVLAVVNVRSLMVVGGGETHASFLREKLADDLALFVSPKVLGGKSPSWVGGKGVLDPQKGPFLKNVRVEKIGGDFLFQGTWRS